MAITFDASGTSGGFSGLVSSLTFPHTCAPSAVLVVAVWQQNGSNNATVTYNGASIAGPIVQTSDAANNYLMLFLASFPPSGTFNIVVSGTNLGTACSASYIGAAIGVGTDATNQKTQVSGPSNIFQTITTITANCLVVTAGFAANISFNPTAFANITKRGGSQPISIGDLATTSTGSYTQTWNIDSANASNIVQMTIKPSLFSSSMLLMFP